MNRTIAIANQKGGVGKTTTSVNLASALASMQKSVLLIDLDPQGNATMGCGVDKYEVEHSVYDLLVDKLPISEVRQSSTENGCDVLPATADLTAAEVELMNQEGREQRLRQCLDPVRADYDYIVIDCPPALNILTLNAFVAADSVLVPIQCEYYALEGLSALLETIDGVRDSVNPDLAIEGLLRTMYDGRNKLGAEVSSQLIDHFGEQVFRTVIPRNVRLAEAPSHGVSIMNYDKTSRGALAYLALAGEILRRRARAAQDLPQRAVQKSPSEADADGEAVSQTDAAQAADNVESGHRVADSRPESLESLPEQQEVNELSSAVDDTQTADSSQVVSAVSPESING